MATATKKYKNQKKYVIGTRPNISKKTLKLLEAMEPNAEALERIKNLVQLKVVDGATCGF